MEVVSMEKVISEFIAYVNGLEYSIKGRITELIDKESDYKFHWSVSHNYRPSENAGVYYPSSTSAKTIEEAEYSLLSYMKNFTTIDVVPNKYF